MLATIREMGHGEGLHPRTIPGEVRVQEVEAWIGIPPMLCPLERAAIAVGVMITALCDRHRLVVDADDGIEVVTATTGGVADPGPRWGGVADGIEAHLREQTQTTICPFPIGLPTKYLMSKSLWSKSSLGKFGCIWSNLYLLTFGSEFIAWVEDIFRQRGLRIDVLILSPRLSEEAVKRRQIIEGVLAIVRLDSTAMATGRIHLQVFDRRGGPGNVQFEGLYIYMPHYMRWIANFI